jgi:DNA-binding CsgD family transcriptional regulator
MARPKIPLDEEAIAQMALDGARTTDISDRLGVDEGTIRKGYSEILRKKRAERRMNLRRKQYEKAMKGDTAMLVWLGKNELDQADKQETKHSGSVDAKLTIEVVKCA